MGEASIAESVQRWMVRSVGRSLRDAIDSRVAGRAESSIFPKIMEGPMSAMEYGIRYRVRAHRSPDVGAKAMGTSARKSLYRSIDDMKGGMQKRTDKGPMFAAWHRCQSVWRLTLTNYLRSLIGPSDYRWHLIDDVVGFIQRLRKSPWS